MPVTKPGKPGCRQDTTNGAASTTIPMPDPAALAPLTEAEASNIKALFADAKYGLVCGVLLHKWGGADDYLAGLDPRQTDRALGRRDIALGLREAVHWVMPRLIA